MAKLEESFWPAQGNFYFPFLPLFWSNSPPMGQALLIHEDSRSHTTTYHTRYDSSGRMISPSQRPLTDNSQHPQQPNIHAPVGFETTISVGERPQTYTLDLAAAGTGQGNFKEKNKILQSPSIISNYCININAY